MKTRSPQTQVTLLLLALLFASLPVLAQGDATGASDSPFAEVIDVRVINLEVVVEEKGVRVHGLQPEDFELTVDGREVPIEYFTEVIGGVAEVRQGSTADATVPAQIPGEQVASSYLVFIDDHFPIARDRNRVLDHLIEQLPNVRPVDQMAVVAFDGRQVDMLSNWTSSVNALTRTLKKAKDRKAGGLLRLAEQRAFRTEQELAAEGFGFNDTLSNRAAVFDDLTAEEEYYARRIGGEVERATMAATATLRSFAQPPGRKVMLLLSGGWPSDPVRVRHRRSGSRHCRHSPGPGRTATVEPLAETANRLGYTIYPVDVPGIETQRSRRLGVHPRRRRPTAASRVANGSARTRPRSISSPIRPAARRWSTPCATSPSSAWWPTSSRTTGSASRRRGRATTRCTTSKVKVRDRKKYKIRTRQNFSDLSRSTEVNMMVESALRFGGAPGGIPLTAEVGRGKSAGWGKRQVPLRVDIPLDALTFLPTGRGLPGPGRTAGRGARRRRRVGRHPGHPARSQG